MAGMGVTSGGPSPKPKYVIKGSVKMSFLYTDRILLSIEWGIVQSES